MSNPFNTEQSNPNNIFNQAAARRQDSGRGNMPEGFDQSPPDYVPSQAVPGQQVPGNPNAQNQIQGAVARQGASPLDKYAKAAQYALDEDTNNPSSAADPNSPAGQKAAQEKDLFDLLQYQDVHGQFRKQDLAASITPELMDKVLKEGDSKAFLQVLNEVAQNAAAAATFGSVQISKQGFSQRMDKFRGDIPEQVRQSQIKNLWQDNRESVLNKPELKPLRDSATTMFAQQYPNATPDQLRTMVEGYFQDVYSSGFGEQERKQKQAEPAFNMQKFLDN